MVAMLGCELTPTQARLPLLERQLVVAAWGLKRLGRYTLFLPALTLSFPDAA